MTQIIKTKLTFSESMLIMLIKGAQYQTPVPIYEHKDAQPSDYLKDYPEILQYYTKYICSVDYVTYREIEAVMTQRMGDLLHGIDSDIFKRAVYRSQGIVGFQKETLFMSLFGEISVLDMLDIELVPVIEKLLVGDFL